jgi:mRNA-degrading endonuclease toxin of MazEF toxin-antitoxin module
MTELLIIKTAPPVKKLGQLTEKEMDAIHEKLLAIFDLWEYLKKRELA